MMETRKRVALGATFICFIMALAELFQPQLVRPTGRWSVLFGPIWDMFGGTGLVLYWSSLGVLAFFVFVWRESFLERLKFITAVALAFIFTACSPVAYSTHQALQTTISEDGMLVAALTHGGSTQQLLRIRHLRDDKQWKTIEAPANLKTIRFGRTGHELLMTYRDAKENTDVLVKIDLTAINKNALLLYKAHELNFPVEIENGTIMIRTSEPFRDVNMQTTIPKKQWLLIDKESKVEKIGDSDMLPFATPNILNGGYFWVEQQTSTKNEHHPKLWSYAFPNGSIPKFDVTKFDKSTSDLKCDRLGRRCLRSYLFGKNANRQFVYDVDVHYGNNSCKMPSLRGVPNRVSVTPDGLAAVMAFADTHEGEKHAVVVKFKPQQCEPTSVEHFYFEEN